MDLFDVKFGRAAHSGNISKINRMEIPIKFKVRHAPQTPAGASQPEEPRPC
jgi:hypothetical protein